jgi:hypothetical protein
VRTVDDADDAYRRITTITSTLRSSDVAEVGRGIAALADFRRAYPASRYDFAATVPEALRTHVHALSADDLVALAAEALRSGGATDDDLRAVWTAAARHGARASIAYVDVLVAHLAAFRDGTLDPDDAVLACLALGDAEVLAHALRWAFANGHLRDLGGLVRPFLERRPAPEVEREILARFVELLPRLDGEPYLAECLASAEISAAARATLTAALRS